MKLPSKILVFALTLLLPVSAQAAFDPEFIISDAELTNYTSMSIYDIEEFLERGGLADIEVENWEGVLMTPAEIIFDAARQHKINPQFLITLLQKEQSLIEDDSPSQKQLDWATGYAVCDSCPLDDPSIQRWRGFGKQVNSASLQFTEGYLVDISSAGSINGKFGPGIPVQIGNQTIVPKNAATASLYAYTPHIHGNQLFYTLWNNWFEKNYPTGMLVKSTDSPKVYLIKDDMRHHIASFAVFASRFDENNIVTIDAAELDAIPEGVEIRFPNYALIRVEGTIYLLANDELRPFASEEVFRSFGYMEDEIIEATPMEIDGYGKGYTINSREAYPIGKLVQLTTSDTMYYIEAGKRSFVHPDLTTLQFRNYPALPITPAELEQLKPWNPVMPNDGYLLQDESTEEIFYIEYSEKRPISAESLGSYGFNIGQVQTVSSEFLNLIRTGKSL